MPPLSKTNRRKFIGSLGLVSVGLALPEQGLAQASEKQEPKEAGFATAPFLENLTPTSCIVSVVTNTKSLTWVAYGERELTQQAYQVEHGLRQSNATLFKIPLTKLKPDTTYRYRIVSKPILDFHPYRVSYGDEQITEEYSFRTPAAGQDSCRTLVFNDLHDKANTLGDFWSLIPKKDIDFVVFNGDIFNHLNHEQQIVDNFLRPIGGLFATRTPFVYLRGNHETRGIFAREFVQYFHRPAGKTYQSFRKGPIYWILLDSGEDKADTDKEYSGGVDFDSLRLEQRDWLLDVVQQKDFQEAPFRIVVMHIPPIHSGTWHGTTHCRELYLPIFNAHGIDAVISGHTHRHALHPPAELNKFAQIIGAGPKEGERTVIAIEATQKELHIKTIQETSGAQLHHWQKKA